MRFDRIVVAPFDEPLLRQLARVPLVVHLRHARDVGRALAFARAAHLNVYRLWIDTTTPLCALPVEECWTDAAIALFVPTAGRYREFQPQVPRLRRLRVRVYLPPADADNLLAARILAGEGVRSAVVLKPPVSSWDGLSDLMTYAIAGHGHVPVEPFAFLAMHYRPGEPIDFGGVYFDDPARFLHVAPDGRVALTTNDLRADRFVADRFDAVPAIAAARPAPPTATCSRCAGWPVCLGRFAAEAAETDHCRRFFADLIDTIMSIRRAA